MEKKNKNKEVKILNKKAKFDYEILESYEAGIILKGTEVKSIRSGSANLKDSYAQFKKGELWLLNTHISKYHHSTTKEEHNPNEKRKLLLHKKELKKLYKNVKEKGLTLIPLKLYSKNGKIKVALSVCRGKKKYDKRQAIKEKEENRKLNQIRNYNYNI